MALKADRQVDATELGYFLDEAAAQGLVVSVSTAGSGIAMDSVSNQATVSASPSGAVPLGILLTETVDIDVTRQPVNWHKDQALKGDKVAIMTKGWAVTDKYEGTITVGDAVLSNSGLVTRKETTLASHNEAQNPTVGVFRSTPDADGFVKVYIDL